jgi:hypothetical protein
MTDNNKLNPDVNPEANPDENTLPRIFKIGSTRIVEDESMRDMTNEQVQETLAFQYPEVANATIHTTEKDGSLYIEWISKPGRKG